MVVKGRGLLIACLIVWSLLQNPCFAANLDYSSKILVNGTRFIYRAVPNGKTVTVRIVFPAGYLTEPHPLRGISHLLEYLIYRGNQRIKPADFRSLIHDKGGRYGSFTAPNRTEYWLESLPDELMPSLKAYSDCIMEPELSEQSIALEKKIVTIEKAMTNKGDSLFLYLNELSEKQFQQSLGNISRSDLVSYHQRYYRTDLRTVIITGPFKPSEVMNFFADGPAPNSKPNRDQPEFPLNDTLGDTVLDDYLQGEKYQMLVGFDLQELTGKELLVAKALPIILNYQGRQYDYENDRPLDYQIYLLNLGSHYYLTFQYRDCLAKYSAQIEQWHHKNLERYFKYLGSTNLSAFQKLLVKSYDKFFEIMQQDSYSLNEYYDKVLFDKTAISCRDASAIQRLSVKDFKAFTEKYLIGKRYHTVIINAL